MYIREAHAVDGSSPVTGEGAPIVEEPLSWSERESVASTCMTKLEL